MDYFLKEYKTRISWLGIGLIGSFFIAKLISSFESVLESNIVLAYFIPLVVYVSDAVAAQMEGIIIKEINVNKKFHINVFFKSQFVLTVVIGITLTLITAIVIYFIYFDYLIAVTIAFGLFFGILSALVTGSMIPYYFWKFHQDPAEASGPIATIIQDFCSVFIFFLVATLLL